LRLQPRTDVGNSKLSQGWASCVSRLTRRLLRAPEEPRHVARGEAKRNPWSPAHKNRSAPEGGRRNPPLLPERFFLCDDRNQGRRFALPLATRRCPCRGRQTLPIRSSFERPHPNRAIAHH
jgi:hypothetical protein